MKSQNRIAKYVFFILAGVSPIVLKAQTPRIWLLANAGVRTTFADFSKKKATGNNYGFYHEFIPSLSFGTRYLLSENIALSTHVLFSRYHYYYYEQENMHSLNTSNHVPRLDLGFISWEARLGKIFSLMENTKLNLDLELMLGYAYQINKRYQQNTGEGNRYVITGQDHTILDDEIQFFDLTTYKTKNAHFGIVSTSLIVEIFSKSQIPHRFSLGFDYYVGFQPIVEHVYGPASELLVFSSRGSGAQLTIGYHLSILDLFKGAKKKRNERYQKGKSTFFFL